LPGPACYDLGGTQPTVTDAFLATGFLDPDCFMGGERRLRPERALQALQELAEQTRQSVETTATAIIATLVRNIAGAIRQRVGIEHPAAYDLFAFGGCGGLVAPLLSETLGVRRIFTFPFGAVFSTFGSANLDIIHQYEMNTRGKINFSQENLLLESWFQELVKRACKEFAAEGIAPERIRYQLLMESISPNDAAAVFEYDILPDQLQLPLLSASNPARQPGMIWLRAIAPIPQFQLSEQPLNQRDEREALKGYRPVIWKQSRVETKIYDRARLDPGARIDGPAVVESANTSLAVPEGWSLALDLFSIGMLERMSL
jgi:N-methylhydantoinase A/oxoprolinase/acetone carboxylase beta subunit